MNSKERIIASFGENIDDYDEEDVELMATYLDQLLKRENKEYFLELICQVFFDSSVKPEHIELIMPIKEGSN